MRMSAPASRSTCAASRRLSIAAKCCARSARATRGRTRGRTRVRATGSGPSPGSRRKRGAHANTRRCRGDNAGLNTNPFPAGHGEGQGLGRRDQGQVQAAAGSAARTQTGAAVGGTTRGCPPTALSSTSFSVLRAFATGLSARRQRRANACVVRDLARGGRLAPGAVSSTRPTSFSAARFSFRALSSGGAGGKAYQGRVSADVEAVEVGAAFLRGEVVADAVDVVHPHQAVQAVAARHLRRWRRGKQGRVRRGRKKRRRRSNERGSGRRRAGAGGGAQKSNGGGRERSTLAEEAR